MLELTLVGGPTALITYAGLRWLTDPTFSPPGVYDDLTKTTQPAIAADVLEPIDVVLLSHEHHADNLDPAGREFLPRAGHVLTTAEGALNLGSPNVLGMEPWSSAEISREGQEPVTVTAVPALHGPEGSESATGPVIGFVLSAPGEDTVYVGGDNASLDVVREVVERTPGAIDVFIPFAGAVSIPDILGGAYLTLSGDRAAEATKLTGARAALPVHFEGWTHFTQDADSLRAAFAGNGVTDRLRLAKRGETVSA
jgi:L-ascorbate metabolism protein UlaG (beta-lactamase superfamily)